VERITDCCFGKFIFLIYTLVSTNSSLHQIHSGKGLKPLIHKSGLKCKRINKFIFFTFSVVSNRV